MKGLEKEILIDLTLENGDNSYIFIGSLRDIIEEGNKDNIIGFLRDHLNKELLIDIFKYNFSITLYSNKIIFNKYREEIPKVLGIDIEDLIIIPNIEDIVNFTIDNLEDFLEEEKGEIDLYFNSYNIDLLIYNIISYYYKNPYKEAKNQFIENLRKNIIEYSNRVIELEEDSNNLYIEYKGKDLEERKESREDYYRELGKLNHRRNRIIDKIKRLEERLKDLEFIE